jgi:methionyl-tRNA formyltransferase
MVEEVDAGPIYAEACIPISPEMSARDVRRKMIEKGIASFPCAWENFLDKKARIPDLSVGKRWPPRSAADGEIGEYWPEPMVRNIVRALCPPWPSAYIRTKKGIVPIAGVTLDWQYDSIPYLTKEGRYIFLVPEVKPPELSVL